MTSKAFLDTNILVYALGDPRVGAGDSRPDRALELLLQGGAVSVQVLNEYVDTANRKLKFDWQKITSSLAQVELLCGSAVSLTQRTHKNAVRIARRYGFRIYDAMIVASALEAGCAVLYSEDLQHGQAIEGLRVENPFRG